MDVSPTAAVNAALAQQQTALQGQVGIKVLKKALDAEAGAAQQLIASLPPPPSPSGSLGHHIDIKA